MNEEEREALWAKARALEAAYREKLPHKLEELEAALARPEGRDEARRLAHRLHGTSGTYGLGGVATLAGQLERVLEDPDDPAWRERAASLLRSLRSGLSRS